MASNFKGHEPWPASSNDEGHESPPNLNLTQLVEHEELVKIKNVPLIRIWVHHQIVELKVGCQCTFPSFGVNNRTCWRWRTRDFVWKHLPRGWRHYSSVVHKTWIRPLSMVMWSIVSYFRWLWSKIVHVHYPSYLEVLANKMSICEAMF